MHSIAVERNGSVLAHLFYFATRKAVWPYIPQHQMVFCTICSQLVTLGLESLSQGVRILHHVLGVLDKVGCVDFEELGCQSTDLMVVRATLKSWEYSHIDSLFDIWDLVGVLVEDHSRARSSQGLV